MTSGTVSSLFFLLLSCTPALAQTQQAQFNQVLNLNGDMKLNSFVFPDQSKIETFSQKQQQLIVNQNTPPVPPNQVTGSTGQPFVALMAQSMSINTNNASNLVGGQIELAMDPQMLSNNAVNPDNTFVAKLSPDRQTWMIQETIRSVNISDMTVRMVKMNNIDGEYMVLGRQTIETNTFLTNFGSDPSTQVAIQGTGLQENEFQDGFRMSIRATQPLIMNVDVKKGIDPGMLTALQGQMPVNDFRYSVTTNLAGVTPSLNQQVTVVQMPINAVRIQQMMQAAGIQAGGQVALAIAQRGVLQNPGGATGNLQGVGAGTGTTAAQKRGGPVDARQVQGGTPTNGNNPVATQLLLSPTFTPIQANAVLDPVNMRIAVPVPAIDGEFILMMQTGTSQTQGQAPAPEASSVLAAAPEASSAAATSAPLAEASSASAASASSAPAAESTGTPTPERRQASGEEQPPAGGVFITMKEVNQMAALAPWGGQAPITKMMDDYVKANGGDSGSSSNGTTSFTT